MIQITLDEGKLPRIDYEKDGTKRNITLSHNTLFSFIENNCYKEKEARQKFSMPIFETPELPPNTVKYMALPDGDIILFMEHKECKHDINYHGTMFKNVPLPNLLFVFRFKPTKNNKYNLLRKSCYAIKNNVYRDSALLYRFPFSHVSSDGGMCFFYQSEFEDLAQLSSFVHIWLSNEFTDHYYTQSGKNKWGWSLRRIFEETQGQPHFDYSKLEETNLTGKDLVDHIVKEFFPIK